MTPLRALIYFSLVFYPSIAMFLVMRWFIRRSPDIKGPGQIDTNSLPPRAWWDQRGIPDASAPEQPQALDLSDLRHIR